jgi:signal transduction histidine kinase
MNRLADFIELNVQAIIGEWETFAQSLPPAMGKMTRDALRDHLPEILSFIAKDMKTSQTKSEQVIKSHGETFKDESLPDTAAETHGALRLEFGFDIMQMASEYRALRASVTKLWMKTIKEPQEYHLLDAIRFNEAIDQALAESITRFTNNLDASKDLFLGILGHDLKNPLGAITMSAHLINKKGPLNDLQKLLSEQITDSAERIGKIVTDLLDLTRARLGSGIPVQKQTMNFGETTNKIVEEIKVRHPDRTILFEVTGNVKGEGDTARIEQVISNLCGNAIQYGQADTPITVVVKQEAETITISVHNLGKPIPASAIATIFDSLVRGPDGDIQQRTGSTNLGLGLYIAKMIVISHRGDLSVKSNDADGTTFTASFPKS